MPNNYESHMLNLIKASFFEFLCFALLALFLLTSCDNSPTLTAAPFEKRVVKNIFFSLVGAAEKEYGIVPIDNLQDPQIIIDFVSSFSSPALFKMHLEKAFIKNGFSYSKTLSKAAKEDGVNIIMGFDGGAGMLVLLAMPSKGSQKVEIDTFFAGQELKDFNEVSGLVDLYLCCTLLDAF